MSTRFIGIYKAQAYGHNRLKREKKCFAFGFKVYTERHNGDNDLASVVNFKLHQWK